MRTGRPHNVFCKQRTLSFPFALLLEGGPETLASVVSGRVMSQKGFQNAAALIPVSLFPHFLHVQVAAWVSRLMAKAPAIECRKGLKQGWSESLRGMVWYYIIYIYIYTYIHIYMFPDKSSLARFPQLSILLHCLRFDRLRPGLAEGGQRYVAVTVLTQNQFLKNSLSDRCSLVSIFMDQYSEE